jgi:hypothetical protein
MRFASKRGDDRRQSANRSLSVELLDCVALALPYSKVRLMTEKWRIEKLSR